MTTKPMTDDEVLLEVAWVAREALALMSDNELARAVEYATRKAALLTHIEASLTDRPLQLLEEGARQAERSRPEGDYDRGLDRNVSSGAKRSSGQIYALPRPMDPRRTLADVGGSR